MASVPHELRTDFPALRLVRTGRLVRLVARATLALLVVSVAAMVFVPWQQTARGYGTVVALDPQERPQPVMSPTKGVISFVKPGLREGSFVEQGELLIRLTPFAAEGVSQIDTQIAAIESKLEAARSSLQVAERNAQTARSAADNQNQALVRDFEATRQKWEQSKNEVQALQADLEDKNNKLRIATQLARQGLEPQEKLFTAQREADAATAKLLKAEAAVNEAYAQLLSKEQEIEGKRQEIDIKIREAEQKVLEEIGKQRTIEKELIELQNKRGEYDRLEITAPRSGFIQQWLGLEGSDTIKEGDQLFVLVPEATQMAVELKVNGNDMPLVQEGDRVRLQFEGWPAVQFAGWPSRAIGTFGGKVNRVYPTDDGFGNFRVIVTEDRHYEGEEGWPSDRYLRQGVRANGWVLLKRVPLGYEIWRQLNGFPPVIAEEEPTKGGKSGEEKKPKLPKL